MLFHPVLGAKKRGLHGAIWSLPRVVCPWFGSLFGHGKKWEEQTQAVATERMCSDVGLGEAKILEALAAERNHFCKPKSGSSRAHFEPRCEPLSNRSTSSADYGHDGDRNGWNVHHWEQEGNPARMGALWS